MITGSTDKMLLLAHSD